MRRESEMSPAVRQRLELLGRDLGRLPVDGDSHPVSTVVPEPGRHARESDAVGSRVLGRVDDLRERLGWSSAHVAVVAVVVAVALAAVAWSALHSAPQEIAAPPSGDPVLSSAAQLVAEPRGASDRTAVVIDVAGRVRRPGVATLPAGSRVIDALKHAGGARRGVDLSTLNLARRLVDGEQILVGVAAASGPAAGAVSSAPASGALVNLNSATAEQLDALPGVGPVTASKIVDWRAEHGAFTAVDELLDVDGIGTKTLAELAPHVTL